MVRVVDKHSQVGQRAYDLPQLGIHLRVIEFVRLRQFNAGLLKRCVQIYLRSEFELENTLEKCFFNLRWTIIGSTKDGLLSSRLPNLSFQFFDSNSLVVVIAHGRRIEQSSRQHTSV